MALMRPGMAAQGVVTPGTHRGICGTWSPSGSWRRSLSGWASPACPDLHPKGQGSPPPDQDRGGGVTH